MKIDREFTPDSSCMIEGWGAALIAGATVVGGAIAAGGAESAAGTQAGAAENAQQISENEFNTITGQEQPFMQAGYGAQSQLNYLLGIGTPGQGTGAATGTAGGSNLHLGVGAGGGGVGYQGAGTGAAAGPTTASSSTAGGYGSLLTPFTTSNFKQLSPAYQFQLQQGQQGVLNQDATSQGAESGAALKDLISFNQQDANTSFNNAFNQYQTQQNNVFSRLSGIAGLGQNAASNTGAQGTQLAGQQAQSATNIGTALASGTVGAANAASGSLSSLGAYLGAFGGGGTGNAYGGGSAGASPYQTGTPYGSETGDYCDYALKADIEPYLFDTQSQLQVYEFRYKGTMRRWRGYIAQEVREKYPNAVTRGPLGFLKVDDSKIPSDHIYPEAAWAEVDACLT